MTFFEALDFLDRCPIGHERDIRYRLQAIQIATGHLPACKEAEDLIPPEVDERHLEKPIK